MLSSLTKEARAMARTVAGIAAGSRITDYIRLGAIAGKVPMVPMSLDGTATGVFRLATDWTGPVVDFVNSIRSERGLPLRAAYVVEPGIWSSDKHMVLFNNFKPKRPNRRRAVVRNDPKRGGRIQ
jgi:hypothetical protein